MRLAVCTAVLATLFSTAVQARCGSEDGACAVENGTYHIKMPEQGADKTQAILWLHGAGGTGKGAMRNTGMVNTITKRGYAFIAADGMKRPGKFGTGWYFHPDWPTKRDEVSFLKAIVADAATNHNIDADRIILAGFSIGGSMASYTACQDPDAFAAYAPVGGSFWRPHPTNCAGSVRLFHTHGWKDKTVPLEGRPLGGGRVHQGDVWHAMQIWRAENGCTGIRADTFEMTNDFWRRKWEQCAPGTALEFALHPGAHGIPPGWADMVISWFETLPIPPE